MHPTLQHNQFFVKEHVGMFRASNNYDIYDPATGTLMLECREPNLGLITKLFRFSDYKRMTPFDIVISTPDGAKVLSVRRGISLLTSEVEVLDENGLLLGRFRERFFSIGSKFDVFDAQNRVLCTLKGSWVSWNFSFVQDDVEIGRVDKQWAGIGKELFTSADNYMLSIAPSVPATDPRRQLILAAVMCIDMVLKE